MGDFTQMVYGDHFLFLTRWLTAERVLVPRDAVRHEVMAPVAPHADDFLAVCAVTA